MSTIKCSKCGGIISLRFPLHHCKSVKVFDGDEQKLIKKITKDERVLEIKKLRDVFGSVSFDIDGDIVCFERIKKMKKEKPSHSNYALGLKIDYLIGLYGSLCLPVGFFSKFNLDFVKDNYKTKPLIIENILNIKIEEKK